MNRKVFGLRTSQFQNTALKVKVALAALCKENKSQYAGMSMSHLNQLRELQDENAKLKRMHADLTLMHHALKDVVERKL